jgi:Domain of unknown function (DUF4388)
MATIGDLQSFALPDLLRTLGNAQQSGQLSVWSNTGVYRIWLNRGSVSAAIAPQAEGTLKALCLGLMSPSNLQLLQPLRSSTTPLSEPLGDWITQQNWLTEEERSLLFQAQLKAGLYPLFELASGQFYFVGDMVPLPYWEMTGLEIPAIDAITQGLNLEADTVSDSANLPLLDRRFLSLTSTTSTALRLSLLDRRLLQWFRQPNTIQSLCQVLNVKPIELQKACKRLLQLQLIEAVVSDLSPVSQSLSYSTPEADRPSQTRPPGSTQAGSSLVQQIAAVLNRPVLGRST